MCRPSVFNPSLSLKERALPSLSNCTNLLNYQLDGAFFKLYIIQLIVLLTTTLAPSLEIPLTSKKG